MKIFFRGKEIAELSGAPSRLAKKAAEALGKTGFREGALHLTKKSQVEAVKAFI